MLFKNVPLMMGIAMALLPAWGIAWEQDPVYVRGITFIVLVLIFKRLLGNRSVKMPTAGKGKVLLYRLLYDRDIKDRDEWVRRREMRDSSTN